MNMRKWLPIILIGAGGLLLIEAVRRGVFTGGRSGSGGIGRIGDRFAGFIKRTIHGPSYRPIERK